MAAGTCTPLEGRSTTGFAKQDDSIGPSHHPVLFVPFTESSSKSLSKSLPALLPTIHTPSGHPMSRSGWPVTSGFNTLPKSSSGKLSKSLFGSPQYEATLKLRPSVTHPLVSCSVNTATRPLIPNSQVSNSHNSSHARDIPSDAPYEPFGPSQNAATSSMDSWIPESHQTVYSTVTTTVSETPQPTLPTPGGQPTVSIPSSAVNIMGSTTPAGWVVASATNVGAPVQGASLSSTGHAFFGNHPAVVFVFLVTGIIIACMAVLVLFCCRGRRGETQPRRRLEDISLPLPQTPMRQDVKSHAGSSDQIAPLQSFISVPFNRSGDSLPTAHSDVDTPLPPPVMQRERRKSSYRVPVRYSGLGAHQGNSRATDWKYTGPFSDYLPTRVAQTHPSPNVPPPLPTRSPLRLLADKNSINTPQDPKRLSRTSSPSLYPPSESASTSEGAIASENNPGMDQGIKKTGNFNQHPGLNSVGSDSAYKSWRARHLPPVASLAPGTGPPQASLLAEVCRMSNCACGIGRHASTRLVDGRRLGG